MTRTLVLHVGLHKTGTSSIQATLAGNRRHLRALGFSYSRLCFLSRNRNHSGALYTLFSRRAGRYRGNLLHGLSGPWRLAAYRWAVAAFLELEMRLDRAPVFILSGEDMSRLAGNEVRALRARFARHFDRIRVVAYVRPPASYAHSAAQERLRGGATLTRLAAAPPCPRYRRRLAKFIRIFGAEHVHLRLWSPARFPHGDAVAAFLEDIGAPPGVYRRLDVRRRNASMSAPAAVHLSTANARLPLLRHGRRNPARARALTREIERLEGPAFRMPAEAIARVMANSQADLAWINARLGTDIAAHDRDDAGPPLEALEGQADVGARVLALNARLLRRRRWAAPVRRLIRR